MKGGKKIEVRSSENTRSYMLDTPLKRLLPALAAPTIAAMLISSIYNLADTFFVSYLGTNATGAVGINATVDQIIMLIGSFFGSGAASYISRLLGAGKVEKASHVLSTALFCSLSVGVLFLIVGMCFISPVLQFFGATSTLLPYAKQYATYIFLAAPYMTVSLSLNQCLRAEGSATRSMIGIISGGIINIALDPLFIFVFKLGVTGAAMATAISKLISFFLLIYPYIFKKAVLKIKVQFIQFKKDIITEIASMGSSSLFRNILQIAVAILFNHLAAYYSESALAAISVVNRISFIMAAICLGFGQGFQPLAGFCWGSREYSRINEAITTSIIMLMVLIVPLSVLLFVFARQVIGLFTTDDAELLRIGILALRAQCIASPLHAYSVLINMTYVGVGRAKGAVFISLCRQGICLLPILFPLVLLFGVDGVAISQAVADILTAIIGLFMGHHVRRLINSQAQLYQSQ